MKTHSVSGPKKVKNTSLASIVRYPCQSISVTSVQTKKGQSAMSEVRYGDLLSQTKLNVCSTVNGNKLVTEIRIKKRWDVVRLIAIVPLSDLS